MPDYTPVIKLPKRKTNLIKQEEIFEPYDCLVSDTLFLRKLPNVPDSAIRIMLQHCMPIEIIMNREKDVGQLVFSHAKDADRAYSLYNGFTFTNSEKLELRMYQNHLLEPEANANLLKVDNLPEHFDDNKLYDVFRRYGPLYLCKCVMIDGQFKGTAFLQFFFQKSSDKAQNSQDGLLLENHKLSVVPYMPSKQNTIQPQKEKTIEEGNLTVDKMNLYIKNLDPSITDDDLTNLFRGFGRIVSARVMSNSMTGTSKGYGFVSFSKPDEAATALQEMNGQAVCDRPLIVAYHEPKTPRTTGQPRQPQSQQYIQPQSQSPQSPNHQHQQYRPNSVHHSICNVQSPIYRPNAVNGINTNLKDLSIGQKPTRKKSNSPLIANQPTSLVDMALGGSIKPTPQSFQSGFNRNLNRRGSGESIMTESTASIQRIKLTEAVIECGDFGGRIKDIVDMLLTLKKKERAACLFNRSFLIINATKAYEALIATETDEVEPEFQPETNRFLPNSLSSNIFIPMSREPTSTVYNKTYHNNNTIVPQPENKAIPIVAPPSSTPSTPLAAPLSTPKQTKATQDFNDEIQALMDSFDGKLINEKKQLLGDKLFPLVKATGTKHAPKVTIRLLDTVDLYELAKTMFDTPLLKARVEEIYNSLQ